MRLLNHTPEHLLYFVLFALLSIFYIIYGYASLGTNDDWALRSLLANKGVYGTLIMSYPLSYIISRLYDLFPSIQWYSLLLSLIIALNFYLIARYIQSKKGKIQKATLFYP